MNTTLHLGDAWQLAKTLPDESINCIVTSPPYFGLRNYGVDGQFGLEDSPEEFVDKLVALFRELRRALRHDGTVWLNLGDSYAANRGYQVVDNKYVDVGNNRGMTVPQGLKPKDLIGIPWRVAFALQADGWWLRQDIIWAKTAPMPESVTDRCTKSHEYVFLLTKSPKYFYDADAIREPHKEDSLKRYEYGLKTARRTTEAGIASHPNKVSSTTVENSERMGDFINYSGRNKRSVWTLGPESFSGWTQISRSAHVERDAVSDDTNCKVSPDCPVHAGLFDWASTDSYDVRVSDLLSRMSRKRTRRAPKLVFGSAPIDQPRGVVKPEQNSDLPHPPYSLFAIDHNTQNHKTGRDPVTNQPCIVSGQTLDCTDDKPNEHDFGEPNRNKPLNNTYQGDSPSSELTETLDRNVGSDTLPDSFVAFIPPECTCSFYHEVTEKTSHFAVMPSKLVEPCILAGCPHRVCAEKIKKLKMREDLTPEEREKVMSYLSRKGLI